MKKKTIILLLLGLFLSPILYFTLLVILHKKIILKALTRAEDTALFKETIGEEGYAIAEATISFNRIEVPIVNHEGAELTLIITLRYIGLAFKVKKIMIVAGEEKETIQ